MRIERLRLTGFKSFVEPTELRIEPGLTGIVGPNGCGKSNLLEAIRWVMGESRARSMRGDGMEDVIFAGTETRPARDFAEVTLVADSEGAALPGLVREEDSGALEVVRRIERGMGSAYRANGRDVRARDVSLIFADAATGAHSPALVSQGKVAGIINAKPQERRQLLEEAAGIAGLHARRKDAEQKLRATESNLAKLADHLADLDQRAGQLRRQARAAERYTRLSEQIRTAEARMIHARWRDAASAADAARAEAAAAEASVTAAQAELEAASIRQRTAVEAAATARDTLAALRSEEQVHAAALGTARATRDALERRNRDLAAEAARIAADRAAEDQLSIDAAAAISELEEAARRAAATIEAEQAARPRLDTALNEAAAQLRDAEVALAQVRADVANESAERRIAEAALSEARRRAARAAADVERLDRDAAQLGDLATLQAARDAAVQVRDAAGGATAGADAVLLRAEVARGAAAERVAETDSALAEARSSLSALESEAAALDRSLSASSGSDGGVLALISVAPGYEAALAAALGDDLSAGVLAEDSDGARGWSRTGDHPADPLWPTGTTTLAQVARGPAELARRLAQIAVIDTDDGRTLAAGQRIVTKDGQLRRWDGFVSSGDGAAAAERLARRNRREALAGQIPDVRDAVAQVVAAHDAARAALVLADSGLQQARTARRAAEEAERHAAREADRADAALERQQAQAAQIAERRAAIDGDHREAAAAATEAEARVAALPDNSASAARLADAERLATAMRAGQSDARSALSTLDARQGAAREAQIEAQADMRGWRARAGEAARRIAAMTARSNAIADEQASLLDDPAQLDEAIAGAEAAREAARQAIGPAIQAENAAAAEARDAERAIERVRDALGNAREHRAGALARAESADLRRVEMGRISGERFTCPPPLLPTVADFDAGSVGSPADEGAAHERLSQERERIGPVNLIAADELAALEATQSTSAVEAEELQQAVNRLRGSIGHLNREGRQRLLDAFTLVDGHFRSLFTGLFGGGEAHLAMVESDDPLEAGLEIMAQPPGKKLQSLGLLSGGEQALTAVALIFALFLTNPAPICVLDEVDAPLDDANVERFCDLLDRMTRETSTRYLIVTHNAVTMSRMHRLFGVTMVERGVSRLVSVDLGAAEQLLAAE